MNITVGSIIVLVILLITWAVYNLTQLPADLKRWRDHILGDRDEVYRRAFGDFDIVTQRGGSLLSPYISFPPMIPRSTHTPKCLQLQARLKAERETWIKKWPDYCHHCGGAGEVSFTENGAPHGEGYWPMQITEWCDQCVGQGACPRCGYKVWSEDEIDAADTLYCSACGWIYTGSDSACPPEFDGCGCAEGVTE